MPEWYRPDNKALAPLGESSMLTRIARNLFTLGLAFSYVACTPQLSPFELAMQAYQAGDPHRACRIAQQHSSWDSNSMALLGGCYGDGIGGYELDKEKAIYWFTLAARYDNDLAKRALAKIGQEIPFPDLAIATLQANALRQTTKSSTPIIQQPTPQTTNCMPDYISGGFNCTTK